MFGGHYIKTAVLLALLLTLGTACFAAEETRFQRGVLIRLEGEINSKNKFYMDRKLEDARALGADLLVVEIDSPGGYLNESLDIARALSKIDWAHTVAFIPDEAISGGAIIALGCDDIIMARDGLIGDAGAIEFDFSEFAFRYAPEKRLTHLREEMRRLAEAKGRSNALIEALYNKEIVVYRVENRDTGEVVFMSKEELDDEDDQQLWINREVVEETNKEAFLEVNGPRAVELGLAQGVSADRDELKKRYSLADDFTVIELTTVDSVVYVLNSWWVTVALFIVGLIALYIEFSSPGIGVGGLTAVLCFSLFFWSRFLGGTADWLEVVLFVSGLVFLAAELFVLPGFGIAGLSGVLLLLASLVLAGQKGVIPETPEEFDSLTASLAAVVTSGVVFAIAAYFIGSHLGLIPVLNRFALKPPSPEELPRNVEKDTPEDGQTTIGVGSSGVAHTPLRPAGKARFGDEYLDVVADGEFIDRGARLRITEIAGNRFVVKEEG